jgi:hypothetical protein
MFERACRAGLFQDTQINFSDLLKDADRWEEYYKSHSPRINFKAEPMLIERAKNFSYWSRIPLSTLAQYALACLVHYGEEQMNGGKPFKPRLTGEIESKS